MSSSPSTRRAVLQGVGVALALLIWFGVASCIVASDDTRAQAAYERSARSGPPSTASTSMTGGYPASYGAFVPSLPVSHPPYTSFHASWVQRLDQPYIYLEHIGSYTETGSILPVVIREMRIQGLEPSGAPFCLFYDDAATTPVNELRSRACIPIDQERSPITPLRYDVLPSRTVAYAYTSGPYPDVPRAHPHLFQYLNRMNWIIDGPIRETYIVAPSVARSDRDYLCEIQIPATAKPR